MIQNGKEALSTQKDKFEEIYDWIANFGIFCWAFEIHLMDVEASFIYVLEFDVMSENWIFIDIDSKDCLYDLWSL